MKNIKKNGNYWFVEENGEIVFQGPDEEACKQYIRREAVDFFRYGMAFETPNEDSKKNLMNILENMPKKETDRFSRFCKHAYEIAGSVEEREKGIVVSVRMLKGQVGYTMERFSIYIASDGNLGMMERRNGNEKCLVRQGSIRI